MKILLSNPPWREEGKIGHRAGARWPYLQDENLFSFVPFPFFLAYATSYLKENGHDAILLDSVVERDGYDDFYKKVSKINPDLTVIETSTPSFKNDVEITKNIKKMIDTKIVFVGPHVSYFKSEILDSNEFIDYVIYGEYEKTLLNLVEELEENNPLDSIQGLVYRKNNEIIENKPRGPVEDMNELPWPERKSLPLKKYYGIAALPTPQLQVFASRGCPYNCIFCVYAEVLYKHKFRPRDPVDIAKEVNHVIDKYGFKSFYFFDDSFNLLGKDRIFKLCDELDRRNIKESWGAQMRADKISEETLKRLTESNFSAACIGIESASPKIQNKIGKNLDLEKAKETIDYLKKLGVKVHLTFTIGLPGETEETIEKTLRFARNIEPYSAQFSMTTPYPGSKYFEMLKRKGYLNTTNWSEYDASNKAIMRTENMTSEELNSKFKWLKKEWKKYIFLKKINDNKMEYLKKAVLNPKRAIYSTGKYIKSFL